MTNGWQTVELRKVMQVEIDAVPVDAQPEFHMAGVYSFARGLFKRELLPNTQTTYKFFHRLHKDMYVISVPKGWEGALARVTDNFEGMYLSPVFPTFRANPKELDIQYFEWYCRQSKVWEELRRKSRGIGARRESISAEQFLTLEIPLPPLTEQRGIVAHIESLATRVNEAQRLREEADLEAELLFASHLKTMRRQLLDNDFPKSRIGDIAQVTSGGTPSRDNLSYWGGDIPWIKTGELIDSDIFGSEEHITEDGMKNSSARLFPPETILIALYGQGQTRGRTGRLMVEATTNQACCAILPTPEILDSRFTQYWQRSLYYEMREKSHGGAQPNWSGGMIKNIEIALPPLDKQRRIVAYLDGLQAKVNVLRELQSASGEELSALMPSILDKAFKGEL
jgi:type I restriction enzyme, S subunit